MTGQTGGYLKEQAAQLVAETIERCIEVVFSSPDAAGMASELAQALPGTVVREPAARLGFHYAPHRWLFIDPHEGYLSPSLAQAHVFDVSGKWCQFRIEGSGARRALSSGFDLDITVADRGCARLSLFDCPTIVAQLDGHFTVCVEASYAASFQTAMQKLNLGR
jgi:sarcosine oxidase gamma subunit